MQMHEEYISIMDKQIYARLLNQQLYTEAEIKAFIDTFEQYKKRYEATNSDTFEILSPMIDFMYFKQTMVDLKNSSKQNAESIN